MSLFTDILLDRHKNPPPPAGIGRTHILADLECELPDQPTRFKEIIAAVSIGATSVDKIIAQLSFRAARSDLVAELGEMVRLQLLVAKKNGGNSRRYFLPIKGNDRLRTEGGGIETHFDY